MRRFFVVVALVASFLSGGCSKGDDPTGGIDIPEGADTYGFVRDSQGNPLSGIAVTDGYTMVQTREDGSYAFKRDIEASFVYYSIPADCNVETDAITGLPSFYRKLVYGQSRYDFKLEKSGTVETRFDIYCIGDPQVQDIHEISRFTNETAADIKAYSALGGVPAYGIVLGDMVDGNQWAYFDKIRDAMHCSLFGMPLFGVIGNHDHEDGSRNDRKAVASYEARFGPVNYSFDRGEIHFVVLDNMIFTTSPTTSGDYTPGITDRQLEWLKTDLSFVPKSKSVILCIHVPYNSSKSDANTGEAVAEIAEFASAHILSAHLHSHSNWIHNINGKTVYEHNAGAACGAHWHSTVNLDGVPIGYNVLHIDGAEVTDWIYKPVRYDECFQLRLYRGSDKFTGGDKSFTFKYNGAGHIIANIWNADSDWTVNVYENGVFAGTMTAYSDKDCWAAAYHAGALKLTAGAYTRNTAHMFYYTLRDPEASVRVEAVDRFGHKFERSEFQGANTTPANYTTQTF